MRNKVLKYVSKHEGFCPNFTFIFTGNKQLATQLSLYSGVQVFVIDALKDKNVEEVVDTVKDFLVEKGELQKGDLFINTLSLPLQKNNRTNTVKLSKV